MKRTDYYRKLIADNFGPVPPKECNRSELYGQDSPVTKAAHLLFLLDHIDKCEELFATMKEILGTITPRVEMFIRGTLWAMGFASIDDLMRAGQDPPAEPSEPDSNEDPAVAAIEAQSAPAAYVPDSGPITIATLETDRPVTIVLPKTAKADLTVEWLPAPPWPPAPCGRNEPAPLPIPASEFARMFGSAFEEETELEGAPEE